MVIEAEKEFRHIRRVINANKVSDDCIKNCIVINPNFDRCLLEVENKTVKFTISLHELLNPEVFTTRVLLQYGHINSWVNVYRIDNRLYINNEHFE